MSNVFEPKQIGIGDSERYEEIRKLYSELVSCTTAFLYESQDLLKNLNLQNDFVIRVLKMKKEDLIIFLKHEYIRTNEISFPGLSIERMIELDLIVLPDSYDTIISCWKSINELLDSISETRFFYPLSRLEDPEKVGWNLTEDFESELRSVTYNFTATPEQNEILEHVEMFCKATNFFMDLNFVKSLGDSWMDISNAIRLAVVMDHTGTRILAPDRKMFNYRFPFEKWGDKKGFVRNDGTRSTIMD